MHIYVVVSSIYIGCLIYKFCTKKPEVHEMDEICDNFPSEHYISKIHLLRFFNDEKNFIRLKKIFDNNFFPEMIKIVNENQNIYNEYKEREELISSEYFSFNDKREIPFEIKDQIFKTNIPQLNFIRWFIVSDYFLYFENEEKKNN